jgi:hypothetical protein
MLIVGVPAKMFEPGASHLQVRSVIIVGVSGKERALCLR